MTYYPQLLPTELKDLLLNYLSRYEIIYACDTLFHISKCNDPIFWKDRILSDFPIKNKWNKKMTKVAAKSSQKSNSKQTRTKYDIFDNVNQFDPKWLYAVLTHYFEDIKNDKIRQRYSKGYSDLWGLLDRIVDHAAIKHPIPEPLFNELMKNREIVAWLLARADGIDIAGYIYTHYPKYRKVALLSVIFTQNYSKEKFQIKYHPTETFTFADFAKINNELVDESIEFHRILIEDFATKDPSP